MNAFHGEQHAYSIPREPCREMSKPVSFGDGTEPTPGPAYNPSLAQVKVSNQQAIFGTSRRVHATQGILR